EVLRANSEASAQQVAEVVRQLAVVNLRKTRPAELPIRRERTLAQEKVAERLRGELLHNLHRFDHVPQRLAALLDGARLPILPINYPVGEHLCRRFLTRGPQHCRPQGAMEARNVLADEMRIARPVLLERRLVVAVADAGDVR